MDVILQLHHKIEKKKKKTLAPQAPKVVVLCKEIRVQLAKSY
jgi:hypothetical protein